MKGKGIEGEKGSGVAKRRADLEEKLEEWRKGEERELVEERKGKGAGGEKGRLVNGRKDLDAL